MRRAVLLICAAPLMAAAAECGPVRNPFWPVGHEGKRGVISAEVRVKLPEVKVAAAAAGGAGKGAAAPERPSAPPWESAGKALRFGDRVIVGGGEDGEGMGSVQINGAAYADGDLVSANHEGWRFTWRIVKVTGKNVRLERIRAVWRGHPAVETPKKEGEAK